jgi:predicted transposase/invertase (TIGR01784 family)
MAVDHDQIFKTLLRSFFREFMELFLPQEAKAIDFTKVEFLEKEVFTDIPSGRRKYLDLVVKVGLKRGGEQFILIHLEFQARKEWDFPERMFQYYCQLYLRHRTPIVPVAIFTDEAVWRKPIPDGFEIGLEGERYVQFRFHLLKLKHLNYRQFLKSENPLAYALMAKMNFDRRERVRLKADFLRLILGARVNPARKSILLQFVETYVPLDRREETEFNEQVQEESQLQEVRSMITTYEKRGIRIGIRKGRREGLLQARQRDLILLLEKKFDKVDQSVRDKILRMRSSDKLESLLLAVLDATEIEELDI